MCIIDRDLDVKIVSQMGGLIELARMEESDILVTAIVGMIGIRPTMEAVSYTHLDVYKRQRPY